MEEESEVVKIFKEKGLHLWFQDPLPEYSIINDLPLK